jgi:ABC-type Fe3+/spermidine/putrescine transport system ATPase subunit
MFEGEVDAGGAGDVRVRVNGIDFVASRRTNAPVAGQAAVVIHPEAIGLERRTATTEGPNVFDGKVLDLAFLGRIQEVMVEVGGMPMRVTQVRGQSYAAGEAVKVVIAPANIILLGR